MALIAGLALGVWLILPDLKSEGTPLRDRVTKYVLLAAAGVLGGLALVGPPLLLSERRRMRGLWGPGKTLWFATGTSAWLLWPPVVYVRVRVVGNEGLLDTASGMCFAYGTPLMAVYVTAALLAGGWFGKRGRRRRRHSWREQFGLLLGMCWACTGLYVIYTLYHEDFTK
jgi:hypothetical protein